MQVRLSFRRGTVVLVLLVLLATAGARAAAQGLRNSPRITATGAYNRMLMDGPRGRLYVDDAANGTVIAWDPTTNTAVGSVFVGTGPLGMALSFDGSELYVGLAGSNAIAVVNPDTLTVTHTIRLSAAPYDLAAGSPGHLYVSTRESSAHLRIVDTAVGVEVGTMTTLTLPPDQLLAVNANRTRLFVGDTSSTSADGYRIAVDGVNLTLDGTSGPGAWGFALTDMALSPDGSNLYLSEGIASSVDLVSTKTMEIVQELGSFPDATTSVALADRGGLLFTTIGRYGVNDSLIAMNATTGTSLGTWSLAGYPALTRAVANGTAAFVLVGTGNKTLVKIPTGFSPPGGSSFEAAAAGSTASGLIPFAISFYSAATGGVPPYAYRWTFGDGNTSSSPAPSHTYEFVGTYRATLTVTDAAGTSRTDSLLVFARATPIPVTVSALPAYGPPPLNVSFSAVIGGGRSPYWYAWSFGDGGASAQAVPFHTYKSNGSYRTTLKVTDSHGATGFAETNVTVVATVLEASIVTTPIWGPLPLIKRFAVAVLGGDGAFTYNWTFGDGGTSILPDPYHTFWLPGYYSVSVQLRDRHGNTASTQKVIQVTLGEPENMTLISTLPGLSYGHVIGGYADTYAPPDPQIAAGDGFVFEMVNDQGRILDGSGRTLKEMNLGDFFGVGPNYLTDPKILYDGLSNRWFASIDTLFDGRIRVAVSAGPDPRGGWYRYALQSQAYPDQPKLGIGGEAVLVSADVFSSFSPEVYLGSETWLINKTDLLFNLPLNYVHSGPNPNEYAVDPVRSLDGKDEAWQVSTNRVPTTSTLELWRWSGHPPQKPVLVRANLTVRPITSPPAAFEPGGGYLLDAGDYRVLDAVSSEGRLWVSLDEGCTPQGDVVTRDCVRLIQVDLSTMSVLRDFDLNASGASLLYPALAIDGVGDVLVVYGYVSSTEYPGIRATALPAGNASATLRPIAIARGLGLEKTVCDPYSVCRYGDYFGAAVDPQAPLRVWTVGERGTTSSWSTELGLVALLDQVRVTASYGPGPYQMPTAPWFEYDLGGVRTNVSLSLAARTYGVDRGGLWRAAAAVPGLQPGSRWAVIGPTSGIALVPVDVLFLYREQYALTTAVSATGAGTVEPGSGWFDIGSSVAVQASPAAGWAFEGWMGTGNGSYSGVASSAVLWMNGTMTETATFFPGLTIVATSGGDVRYSYANISGTVADGTTRTLYLPPGTSVTLSAIPTGAGNVFHGWSGGASGTPAQLVVNVSTPLTIVASFQTPLGSVLALWPMFVVGGAVAATAVIVWFWRRRKVRP